MSTQDHQVPKAAIEAVKEVLTEAAATEHFFDLSDAERLTAMLVLAFEKGRAMGAASECSTCQCDGRDVIACRPSQN